MSRVTILLVAVMVLLAGCSSGGNGGTDDPTTEMTDTPDDSDVTPTPGGESDGDSGDGTDSDSGDSTDGDSGDGTDSDSGDSTDGDSSDSTDSDSGDSTDGESMAVIGRALNNTGEYEGPSRIEMTLTNGTQTTHLTVINDTERELIILNESQRSGETTYYVTDGPDAVRNTTSGEIRYGSGESRIEQTAGFAAGFTLLGGFIFVGVMDWQPAGETTVNGGTAQVFEANSLNQTRIQEQDMTLNPSEVTAATGRMVVDETTLRSASITMETTQGTIGLDLTIETGSQITVEKPDWIDDDQFEQVVTVGFPR